MAARHEGASRRGGGSAESRPSGDSGGPRELAHTDARLAATPQRIEQHEAEGPGAGSGAGGCASAARPHIEAGVRVASAAAGEPQEGPPSPPPAEKRLSTPSSLGSGLRLGGRAGRRLGRRLFAALAATAALVLAMVPIFCLYVEASKELHVKDGSVLDAHGRLVATAEYVSYASLFDLPSFSARTLAAVKQVDLRLSATKEAVFSVSGVVKHSACQAVTFYLLDAGELVVDGRTGTAVAIIRGKRHVLRPPDRRLGGPSAAASAASRLLAPRELFGGAHAGQATAGAARAQPPRRLRELEEEGGWATLGISAAEAILDECSLDAAAPHESASISGRVMIGDTSAEMHAFYNRSDPRQSAVRVTHLDGSSVLTDYAVGFEFNYDSSGQLVECEPAAGARAPGTELESLEAAAVAGRAVLVSDEDADGVEFLVQVGDFLLDSKIPPLQRPSVEDCLALERRRPEGNAVTPPSSRRLLGGCGELYSMALASYDRSDWYRSKVAAAGWIEVGACKPEGQNAHARVWTRDGKLAVGFGGSDEPDDWVNNLDTSEHSSGMHSGFVQYVGQVSSCIERIVSEHGGEIHFYVGHSLGGAAATVYYELSGRSALDARVVTYGAPKTHSAVGCAIPGTRYAHMYDPVASNFWGIMQSYHHKVSSAVFYQDSEAHRRRRRWSWRRRRNWRWDADLAAGCSQETDAGYLLDTMYHFAITHLSYGFYGDQSC